MITEADTLTAVTCYLTCTKTHTFENANNILCLNKHPAYVMSVINSEISPDPKRHSRS